MLQKVGVRAQEAVHERLLHVREVRAVHDVGMQVQCAVLLQRAAGATVSAFEPGCRAGRGAGAQRMYRDCVASVTIEDAKVCMRRAAALVSLANESILLRTAATRRGEAPQARSARRACAGL